MEGRGARRRRFRGQGRRATAACGAASRLWAASDVEQMFSSAMLSRLIAAAGTQSCRRPSPQLSLRQRAPSTPNARQNASTSMESHLLGRTRTKSQAAFAAHLS